jgi:hypothetical protein
MRHLDGTFWDDRRVLGLSGHGVLDALRFALCFPELGLPGGGFGQCGGLRLVRTPDVKALWMSGNVYGDSALVMLDLRDIASRCPGIPVPGAEP